MIEPNGVGSHHARTGVPRLWVGRIDGGKACAVRAWPSPLAAVGAVEEIVNSGGCVRVHARESSVREAGFSAGRIPNGAQGSS